MTCRKLVNPIWKEYLMNFLRNMRSYRHYFLALLTILAAGLASCDRSSSERVLMRTELGDITLEIETEKAPVTASNFLSLVKKGAIQRSHFLPSGPPG